ncbi:MAG TPA: site-specific integrase [Syntrophales bacterium]|nr:site-specific integrase [Syntrophales bacterium]
MEANIVKKLTSPQNITLYRRTDTPYIYYYFTWKGKSYKGTTGKKEKQAAIDRMNSIYYELTHDIRKTKIVKFEKISNDFLKYIEKRVSPKTFTEYQRGCKNLCEKFGKNDIEKFGGKNIYLEYQSWRSDYYKTHQKRVRSQRNGEYLKGRIYDKVGNTTLNRECRLLVSILRFGKEYSGVLKGKDIMPYTILEEKRRENILNKADYLTLKEYWKEKNPYYAHILSFLNNTGIRYPSELNNLKWNDVELKRERIIIRDRKNKSKKGPISSEVPITDSTKEILQSLKEREGISTKPNDYVFVDDNGKRIKNIGKSFKKSLIACGIDRSITMYSLRHVYTTRMMKRPDIPVPVISMILGHRDTTMVENRYGHLKPGDGIRIVLESEQGKKIRKEREKKKNQE